MRTEKVFNVEIGPYLGKWTGNRVRSIIRENDAEGWRLPNKNEFRIYRDLF